MKTKTIIIPILAAILSACSINMPIRYKTKDIQSSPDKQLSAILLDIEDFTDKRKEYWGNEIFFSEEQIYKGDAKTTCINSEKYYKKVPVPLQMSQMLVEHLNKKNSFKKVVKNKKDSADYYITGNLTRFYGKQGFSKKAATSAYFGVVGAIVAANATTDGKIIFEISDLKIFDKNHQLVKDLGTYTKEYEGEFPADAYCWCIYENVNTKLKDYYSGLIHTIETEIKNIQ